MKIRQISINIFVLLVFLAIAGLVSEIGVRLVSSQINFYSIEIAKFAKKMLIQDHLNELTHVNKPNASGRFMGVDISFNSLGYRYNEISKKKSGEYRVLVLGSSQAMGWGVEQESTFSEILERKLDKYDEKYRKRKFRIINAATVNYSICDENRFLQRQEKLIDYDTIILQMNLQMLGDIKEIHSSKVFYYSYLSVFLFERYFFLHQYIFPSENETFLREIREQLKSESLPAQKCLQNISYFLKQRNKKFLIFLTPNFRKLTLSEPAEEIQDNLLDYFRKNKIAAVNMVTDFNEKFSGKEDMIIVNKDDSHPNMLAHQLIADILFNRLAENNLISWY